MTVQDMNVIMGMLEGAYPGFFHSLSRGEKMQMLQQWTYRFAEDDPQLVMGAVESYINTENTQYPPSIGQVKNWMLKLCTPNQPTAEEAWPAVSRAIGGGYRRLYDELPAFTQEVLGSFANMKRIGKMDADKLDNIGKAQFIKDYNSRLEKKRQDALLPPSVKALASAMAAKLALPEE